MNIAYHIGKCSYFNLISQFYSNRENLMLTKYACSTVYSWHEQAQA